MDQQPDYSKYAEPELLQIRKHIDAARYPERVAEIEARLAALAAAPTATQSIHEDLSPVTIAKLWRRVVAFKIDSVLFFIIGLIAGEFLSDQFAALGPWGKVLGFTIATTYFGVSQSSIGGGQSLGMKILGIKVSTSSGTSLGLRASLIRAGIFCLYYFLSGLPSFPAHGELPIPGILMPLLGVGFCSLYLLTFNRKTRQGLHDWAVRAFVVKAAHGPLALPTERVWRGHVIVVAVSLLVFCAAGIGITLSNSSGDLPRVQQAVSMRPEVNTASAKINYGQQEDKTLAVSAIIDASTPDRDALAQRIAKITLKNYAGASQMKTVTVTLSSGFDIGIAHSWHSVNYTHTPQVWRIEGPTS